MTITRLGVLLAILMTAAIQPTHGDISDVEGRKLTWLYIAKDESSGETDSAMLVLYDQSKGPSEGGWLSAECEDATPLSADVDLLVQTTQHRLAEDSETFRVRVDRNATRRWQGDVRSIDYSEQDERPASFGTAGEVPEELAWGLIAELVAGKRMIAQIGDLPVVTLDLEITKPDIVEFHNACERMWRSFLSSPRAAADFFIEDVDPFGEGWLLLRLFHQTIHDGGVDAQIHVVCRNEGDDHGVDVLFVSDPLPRGPARLGFDSDTLSEIRLQEWNPSRVRLDLSNDAAAFVDKLATAGNMTLHSPEFPTLQFDLARGRPEIADFRAKCRTLLANTAEAT